MSRLARSRRTSILCRTFGIHFSGVHFTVTNDGKRRLAQRAIPALWRGTIRRDIEVLSAEFIEIAGRGLSLLGNAGFRV